LRAALLSLLAAAIAGTITDGRRRAINTGTHSPTGQRVHRECVKANESPPLLIAYQKVDQLKPYDHNARTHSNRQIKQTGRKHSRLWFHPVLVTRDNSIVAGHGRVKGAKVLNINEVPTIRLELLPQLLVGKVAVSIELHLRAQNLDCRRTPVSQ
jgi:hypothetical protein